MKRPNPFGDWSWKALAADFHRHLFGCPQCIAAGQNRGEPCDPGAEIRARYENAFDAAGQPAPAMEPTGATA